MDSDIFTMPTLIFLLLIGIWNMSLSVVAPPGSDFVLGFNGPAQLEHLHGHMTYYTTVIFRSTDCPCSIIQGPTINVVFERPPTPVSQVTKIGSYLGKELWNDTTISTCYSRADTYFQKLSLQVNEIRVAFRTHNPEQVITALLLVCDHLDVPRGYITDNNNLAQFVAKVKANKEGIALALTASLNANGLDYNLPLEVIEANAKQFNDANRAQLEECNTTLSLITGRNQYIPLHLGSYDRNVTNTVLQSVMGANALLSSQAAPRVTKTHLDDAQYKVSTAYAELQEATLADKNIETNMSKDNLMRPGLERALERSQQTLEEAERDLIDSQSNQMMTPTTRQPPTVTSATAAVNAARRTMEDAKDELESLLQRQLANIDNQLAQAKIIADKDLAHRNAVYAFESLKAQMARQDKIAGKPLSADKYEYEIKNGDDRQAFMTIVRHHRGFT